MQILSVEVKKWSARESNMEKGDVMKARTAPMEVDLTTPLADEEDRRRQAEERRSQRAEGAQQQSPAKRGGADAMLYKRGDAPWHTGFSKREQELHDAWTKETYGAGKATSKGPRRLSAGPPDDPGAAANAGPSAAAKEEEPSEQRSAWDW